MAPLSVAAMAVGLTTNEFHIAPMQCYTNQPLRKLTNLLSPSSIKWTEMEKVDDLIPDVEHSLEKRLGGEEEENNLILQLGSNDVHNLEQCVKVATHHFPDLKGINLNCGCPAIDTGGAPTYGASLMKDVSLTAKLVESMVTSTDIDISVKCRIGVFDTADDVQQMGEKHYQYLHEYVSAVYNAGANHVILHARPAILSMSPVKNRIVPTLNYNFVKQIASDFDGKVKITLNGGINSLEELKSMQNDEKTLITSHMSGRWCLRRPLDLTSIEGTLTDSLPNAQSAVEKYIDYVLMNQNRFPMADLCLPLYLVVSQLQEDYDTYEEGLLSWQEIEVLYDALEDGLVSISSDGKVKRSNLVNFKKLAASFKPLVGTKVVNKWKRNRAEFELGGDFPPKNLPPAYSPPPTHQKIQRAILNNVI